MEVANKAVKHHKGKHTFKVEKKKQYVSNKQSYLVEAKTRKFFLEVFLHQLVGLHLDQSTFIVSIIITIIVIFPLIICIIVFIYIIVIIIITIIAIIITLITIIVTFSLCSPFISSRSRRPSCNESLVRMNSASVS